MDSINMMRVWGEERYKEINNRMKEFIEIDGETQEEWRKNGNEGGIYHIEYL